MKAYFFHNGTEQEGPFTLGQLKLKPIKKETPIWFDGLADWKNAGEIEELQPLFNVTPPPLQQKSSKTNLQSPQAKVQETSREHEPIDENDYLLTGVKRKSKKRRNGVLLITVLVVLIGGAFIYNEIQQGGSGYSSSGSSSNNYEGAYSSSYQEEKMSIKEKERAYPTDFLSADGTYRENLLGDKLKVNGVIENNATVATYKDAIVRVTYYSKSNTNLGSEDYTIWEVFKPHSTTTFKLKIQNYSNVKSIGWDVIDASVVY